MRYRITHPDAGAPGAAPCLRGRVVTLPAEEELDTRELASLRAHGWTVDPIEEPVIPAKRRK